MRTTTVATKPLTALVGQHNGFVTYQGEYADACTFVGPEVMFPEERSEDSNDSPEVNAAKAVCGTCFFKQGCLEKALARREPHGVWGGMSTKDRDALRRRHYRGRQRTEADVPLDVAL